MASSLGHQPVARKLVWGAVVLWLVLAVLLVPHGQGGGAASPSSPALKLPLSFVPNRGQTDARVRYYAQTPGFAAYFTPRGVTMAISKGGHGRAIELRFPGRTGRRRSRRPTGTPAG